LEFNHSSFTLLDTVLVLTWLPTQGKQYKKISNTDWAVLQVSSHTITNITIYFTWNTQVCHSVMFLPGLNICHKVSRFLCPPLVTMTIFSLLCTFSLWSLHLVLRLSNDYFLTYLLIYLFTYCPCVNHVHTIVDTIFL